VNFERVGDNIRSALTVRVVRCTNRDLKAAVVNGTFRETSITGLNVFRSRCLLCGKEGTTFPCWLNTLSIATRASGQEYKQCR